MLKLEHEQYMSGPASPSSVCQQISIFNMYTYSNQETEYTEASTQTKF